MKNLINLLSLLLIISGTILFSGCDDTKAFPCEKGEGARVTEVRSVSGFSKIMLDLPGDVYITRDSIFSLEITAQDNIIDEIDTDVSGDFLEIRNDRCIRQYKTIRIDLGLPELSMIDVKGSGDVYVLDAFNTDNLNLFIKGSGSVEMTADARIANLEIDGSGNIVLDCRADEIDTKIEGSGDLVISGSTDLHHVDMDGSGKMEGFDLLTLETRIDIAGSGDAKVSADSLLDVRIRGSGNVYYRGNPILNVNVTGSGEVINAN